MKLFSILVISILISNLGFAQYDTGYGGAGGGSNSIYGGPQSDPNDPSQKPGGIGAERKDLMAPMDTTSPTQLSAYDKCKSECDGAFVQCYRIETDRAACYNTSTECLGKCPADPDANPDYNNSPFGTPNQNPQGGGSTLSF